jgi:hypothetical protein
MEYRAAEVRVAAHGECIIMSAIRRSARVCIVIRPRLPLCTFSQAFVYIFNLLQTPNVAWQSFLQLTLHFEPYILVS